MRFNIVLGSVKALYTQRNMNVNTKCVTSCGNYSKENYWIYPCGSQKVECSLQA